MCGTTRPAGAGMMNMVSLCNESCLTSPPDKQVLWCGRGRHVGSNLVTIHHNRMWQTADKRHNLVTQTTFWSCSISKQVLNSKFQILCLYTHAPLAFKVVLPTTGFRNSNSFICIPRIPFLAQNCPPKCVFLNVTLYTFCVYVCVCVCVVGKYFKHWRGSLFCLTESQLCQKFMMSPTTTQHHPMRIIADGAVCVWHFDQTINRAVFICTHIHYAMFNCLDQLYT